MKKEENILPLLGAFFSSTNQKDLQKDAVDRIINNIFKFNPWEKPSEGPYGSCVEHVLKSLTKKTRPSDKLYEELFEAFFNHPNCPPPEELSQLSVEFVEENNYKKEKKEYPILFFVARFFPSLLPTTVQKTPFDQQDTDGRSILFYTNKENLEELFSLAQKQKISLVAEQISSEHPHAFLGDYALSEFKKSAIKAWQKYPLVGGSVENKNDDSTWKSVIELVEGLQGRNIILKQIKILGCEKNLKNPDDVLKLLQAFNKRWLNLINLETGKKVNALNLRYIPKPQQSAIVSLSKWVETLAKSFDDNQEIQKEYLSFRLGALMAKNISLRYLESKAFRDYIDEFWKTEISKSSEEKITVKDFEAHRANYAILPHATIFSFFKNYFSFQETLNNLSRENFPFITVNSLNDLLLSVFKHSQSLPLETLQKENLGRLILETTFNPEDVIYNKNQVVKAVALTTNSITPTSFGYSSSDFTNQQNELVRSYIDAYIQSNQLAPLPETIQSPAESIVGQAHQYYKSIIMKKYLGSQINEVSSHTPSAKKKM